MLVGGVDEAGRGPVIGPMVIACVVCREGELKLLKRLGVRDSKALTPLRRRILYKSIGEVVSEIKVKVVSPQEIDEKLTSKEGNLNDLEAEVTVELISSLTETPYAIYLDSPDPVAKRYSDKVVKLLSSRGLSNVIVIAENGADKRYPIVSAASIVAKVIRDKEVEELKKLYGDFGSGYPSDPKTLRFLRDCLRKGYLPPIVRRSWSTLRRFGA